MYERGEVQRRIEPNYGVNPMLGAHIGLELAAKFLSHADGATAPRHPT